MVQKISMSDPVKISVIVPVFNEQKNIARVLELVTSWNRANDVIVIDDGSTDDTSIILTVYISRVHLITHFRNLGKGAAIACGIEQSKGDLILCVDADAVGLTHQDLHDLVEPLIKKAADMVIGIHSFPGIGKFRPYDSLSGQRSFWKKDLVSHLPEFRTSRWGVEVVINSIFKHKRVIYIKQNHAYTMRKIDKWPFWQAQYLYVKQAIEVFQTIVKVNLNRFKF